MTNTNFLMSVSLREDISVPERLAHYRPTRRSLPVVRAVLADNATMVIAAYGSGKSLAAGIGALFVLNEPAVYKSLGMVLKRINSIDSNLAMIIRKRRASRKTGRIIVLTGYIRNLAETLAKAAGLDRDSGTEDLTDVLKKLSLCDSDRIAIVWDEFGRHLEGLITEGRARDLHMIQRLAEWTSRATNPSTSLVLLMHQSLFTYATNLNQTSRNEWRKVSGRFRHVRFVEDSRELYDLIAEIVSERRPNDTAKVSARKLSSIVKGALRARWFDGLEDVEHVRQLLSDAYPMTAAALQVLPHVIARLGQNERSLFNFIEESEFTSTIGTSEVYYQFSDTMRYDVGIGGMHRRWLETENAISRVEDALEREALTAACLLQLGVDGERRRINRDTLELAIASRGCGIKNAVQAVDSLISRKLLIHRRRTDDVSVWHGADVDLDARIRDERSRREDSFDLVEFLEANNPAPFVRPTRHNIEHGTARYLSGHYITAQHLFTVSDPDDLLPDYREWGRIYYVLSESVEDITAARKHIMQKWAQIEVPIVFVLSDEPVRIKDAALEVAVTATLRTDDVLLGEDPLISQEIDELLSVAQRQLELVLHRLITDKATRAAWLHAGRQLAVTPECPAGIATSDLMDSWYPMTPRIVNDQIMRNRLSRQMQTTLVRVIMRIMEQGHKPHLGLASDDTSSVASVYRTVLSRTGIHFSDKESGCFAEPAQIEDPGLRRAWELIAQYFRESQTDPKPLTAIVTALTSRPIGVPLGVVPLLVMAGYRAFARAVSLRTDGMYVPDVLGYESSNMFIEPERHTVTVYEVNQSTLYYLQDIADIFDHVRPRADQELLRFAYDALQKWKASIPYAARRSARLSKEARLFMRQIIEVTDPAELFLERLPTTLGRGCNGCSYKETVTLLERVRNDIDNLVEGYVDIAVDIIGETLTVSSNGDLLSGVRSWVSCFDVQGLLQRSDLRLTDKAVLRTAQDTLNGRYSAQSFSRALSSVLLQRRINQWEDTTVDHFRMLLRECKRRIEDTALASDIPNRDLVPLVQARIDALQALIQRISEDN